MKDIIKKATNKYFHPTQQLELIDETTTQHTTTELLEKLKKIKQRTTEK